jgi:hypothetical protein
MVDAHKSHPEHDGHVPLLDAHAAFALGVGRVKEATDLRGMG